MNDGRTSKGPFDSGLREPPLPEDDPGLSPGKGKPPEETFRALFDNAHDAIVVGVGEGEHVYANGRASEITGYSREELLHLGMRGLADPEELGKLRARLEKRLEGDREPSHYETAILRKDGDVVPIELTSVKAIWEGEPAVVVIFREITTDGQAEEALRESEVRYRTFFEEAADAILLIDPSSGAIVDLNAEAKERYGYSREMPSRLRAADLEIIESPEEIQSRSQRIIKEGSDLFETKHRTKSGEILDVIVSAKRIELKGRVFLQAIVRDITVRKQMEESLRRHRDSLERLVEERTRELTAANEQLRREITERERAETTLRESESKYSQLFTTVSDAIILFDGRTRQIIDVNEAATRLYGYSREEFLALKLPEISAEPEETDTSIRNSLEGKTSKIPLRYHRHKNGTVFPVEISVGLIEIKDRRIVCGVIRDITERKRLEDRLKEHAKGLEREVEQRTRALKESERKHRDLVEKINEGIVTVDRGGIVTFVNSAYRRITGFKKDEVVGKHFAQIPWVTEKQRDVLEEEFEKRTQLQPSRYEMKVAHRSTGKTVYVLASATPIQGPQGEFAGSYAVVTDITENKTLERDLEELSARLVDLQEKERRRIAADLHDAIGGALTGMKIELELLGKTPEVKGLGLENRFKSILNQIDSTVDLVQDISYELRPAILDDLGLPSALRWYVNTFQARTRIKTKLSLRFSGERLPEPVKIAIFRVTQEALTNVAKHAEAGLVNVTLSKREKEISLIIRDDGVGFDPKASNPEVERRGIGIFGIKERLRPLGGRLDLQSEPGEGTRLVATIPLGSE